MSMTYVQPADTVRNPQHRVYRDLVEKEYAPELAASLAGNPFFCQRVLGDLYVVRGCA